jgi:phosphomannomutase
VSDERTRTPIRFGTDGWRAVIADQFTFANLERVAQAYADYLLQQHAPQTEKSLIRQLIEVGQISEHEAEDGLFRNVIRGMAAQSQSPLVVVGYDRRFLSEKFSRATTSESHSSRKPCRRRSSPGP